MSPSSESSEVEKHRQNKIISSIFCVLEYIYGFFEMFRFDTNLVIAKNYKILKKFPIIQDVLDFFRNCVFHHTESFLKISKQKKNENHKFLQHRPRPSLSKSSSSSLESKSSNLCRQESSLISGISSISILSNHPRPSNFSSKSSIFNSLSFGCLDAVFRRVGTFVQNLVPLIIF